jgi:elongation factor 1-alpha
MSKEIRIGVVGNVDSGKSTFIGVYKNGILDNGRGLARESVLRCPHEKLSGRTSSISQQYVKIDNDCKKSLVFVDLAGHKKYLKTTLHGLSGYFLDHVFVMIGANMGISRMTREHMSIVFALKIPFTIILTKIDICPKNVYIRTLKTTINTINKMCKRRNIKKKIKIISNDEETPYNKDNVNIYSISNKTGLNMKHIKKHCKLLIEKYENKQNKSGESVLSKLFVVDNKYNVPCVGVVIAGKMFFGNVKKNEQLYIGPFNEEWYKISIKSFHDNFRNKINELCENEGGTMAIKFINLHKDRVKKLIFCKGIYVIGSNDLDRLQYKTFEAEVSILVNHSTTIKKNYQPIINCGKIVQSANVEKIYNENEILRAGDKCIIKLSFKYRAEFINIGDTFVFREGNTKGVGIITKLI